MSQCMPNKHHCADCPIRRQALARPQSLFARIHRWHSAWWPLWKAYQADLHGACGGPAAQA